jgi:hypothetical protein
MSGMAQNKRTVHKRQRRGTKKVIGLKKTQKDVAIGLHEAVEIIPSGGCIAGKPRSSAFA